MKIGIAGYRKTSCNYEAFLRTVKGVDPVTSLSLTQLDQCKAILFPGGGDIDPVFWGEKNKGSQNIDTALDLQQFHIMDHAIKKQIPILGICKGMQLINVALGGTICQHIPYAFHYYQNGDHYHPTIFREGSFLYNLYGHNATVNSAHHQAIEKPGVHLTCIQWCPYDSCVEAICHDTLPIIGVQWHPERLDPSQTTLDGTLLLRFFLAQI